MSLIDYDPVYKSVMEYVFGSKFVCFDLDTAKKIAYHPQILQSTVTLDGDCFDPEGTLSGGARAERSNILIKLGEMKGNLDELNKKESEITNLEKEITIEREKSLLFSNKKNEYNLHLQQLNLAKISLEQNSHHQKLEKANSVNLEILEKREQIENSSKELSVLDQKKIELEEKILKGNDSETSKKEAQLKINDAKLLHENKQNSSNQLQQVNNYIKNIFFKNNSINNSKVLKGIYIKLYIFIALKFHVNCIKFWSEMCNRFKKWTDYD